MLVGGVLTSIPISLDRKKMIRENREDCELERCLSKGLKWQKQYFIDADPRLGVLSFSLILTTIQGRHWYSHFSEKAVRDYQALNS